MTDRIRLLVSDAPTTSQPFLPSASPAASVAVSPVILATQLPTAIPTPVPTVDPDRTHPTPVPAAQRRLDRAFATMAAEVGAPGLAAAVRLPDGTVWYGTTGLLWPDGPAVTADTPFAWGSITKTVVAALVLPASIDS